MESLYFLALVPPADIRKEIRELKLLVADRYNSNHALRSPAHITLHMPFKWKDARTDQLHACLSNFALEQEQILISLHGFDYFEPRVLFVKVDKNEQLKLLQHQLAVQVKKELGLLNADYKNRAFHPHMTIAFRDLRKPQFYTARDYFSTLEYRANFLAEGLTLLKHERKEWHIHRVFKWGQGPS